MNENKSRRPEFLAPLRGKVKSRQVCVIDLESKHDDTQAKGFTRPFLAGFACKWKGKDGKEEMRVRQWRNKASVAHLPWQERALAPGGCVDQLMRLILGERKYQGCNIYAHNGGAFDYLHILPWLSRHENEFAFEIMTVQSSIQKLDVWPKHTTQCLETNGFPWEQGDQPRCAGCRPKKQGVWTFLDSVRLIPMGLDDAAKTFLGPEKGKLKFDLDTPEDDLGWMPYNRGDLVKLWDICTKAREHIEKLGGQVGITVAATAMQLYRRSFLGQKRAPAVVERELHFDSCTSMVCPVCRTPGCQGCFRTRGTFRGVRHDKVIACANCHDPKCEGCRDADGYFPWETQPFGRCPGCLHEWVRRGYYGGRTEVFHRYMERGRSYDINGSYARAMCEDMPSGKAVEGEANMHPSVLAKRAKREIGFVECTVEIPDDCAIPPLPVRSEEHGGKLIFPTGTFSGVWDVDELALLAHPLVGGRIAKVHRSVWYRRGRCFVDYIETLATYRDKDRDDYDDGLSRIAKDLQNNLYGKFAMNPMRTRIVHIAKGELPPVGAVPLDDREDCRSFRVIEQIDAAYIIPQISAHVTALARIRLFEVMAEVRRLGGRVYYTDTDSVFCDVEIPTRSSSSSEHAICVSAKLGDLKAEYDGHEIRATFLSPKLYCAEDLTTGVAKIKAKGVPKEERTRENFKRFEQGLKVEFDRLEKIGGLSHRSFESAPRLIHTSKRNLASVKAQAHKRKQKFLGPDVIEKRIFAPDGSSVPFHLTIERQPIKPIESWTDIERFPWEARQAAPKRMRRDAPIELWEAYQAPKRKRA